MKNVLAITLASAVLAVSAGLSAAMAADAAAASTDTDTSKKKAEPLQEVVVTGSLIPQVEKETAQPVATITQEDIQQKGFASVADALQHSSFATGAVQGPQTVNGFTPGAQTLSLFGLSPSYTKYLIDGRPIADYPALYNGTDIITSISGIPTVLIDHIDILPGGQSSIYGSDAIAGVVNINLRKKMDGLEADARYGWTKDGGGSQTRLGLADGFSFGNFSGVVGGQYEKIDPIWGYQRPMTQQYFNGNSSSPQVAERDWLLLGFAGPPYYFEDPNNCANVTSQFGGTVGLRSREGRGDYCGTYRAGFYTLNNGQENTQGYAHLTYDINSSIQIFADALLSHEVVRFNPGGAFWSTQDDGGPLSFYYDPNVGDLMNVQRIFSPEEIGNLSGQDNKNTTNSTRVTGGLQGGFGASNWKYIADFTYTENKLTEATHLAFTDAITNFFTPLFGPNLGPDPFFGSQPTFIPNYAQLYTPITPAQYASFTGYATSYSRTEDSLGRVQLTDSQLFALPGGDAGVALVAEGGRQSWEYTPDPNFLDGGAYLYTAVAGAGHRTRYAGTGEVRLPVLQQVTLDMSGRYDDYKYDGGSFNKFTYNIGLEYRPVKSFLVRGRYGTAFKAPTLSDQFQGQSGFFTSSANDYYYCTIHHEPINTCTQAGQSFFGTTEGNPALKPINATVWDGGIVWSPVERSSFGIDYLHWHITNEVQQQDTDQLLRTESACLLGQLDPTTPTCVAAIAQVHRDPTSGLITQIDTPKQNLAEENLDVLLFTLNYGWNMGAEGTMVLDGSYTHVLKHNFVRFPGDPQIDYLTSPFYSTEFQDKANLALTWNFQKFSTTVYGEYYGNTPNYQATLDVSGYAQPGAAKLGAWVIANWSASYEILSGFTVSANVNNVFNKQPPFDNSYQGIDNQPYNTLNYNDYGRSYFVGANYKFGH